MLFQTRTLPLMSLPRSSLAVLAAMISLYPLPVWADSVSDQIQRFMDNGSVSGAVTLVATKSGIAHWEAVGKSDLATVRDMQKDDLFARAVGGGGQRQGLCDVYSGKRVRPAADALLRS
jgi:hypothetical protein